MNIDLRFPSIVNGGFGRPPKPIDPQAQKNSLLCAGNARAPELADINWPRAPAVCATAIKYPPLAAFRVGLNYGC